MAPELGYNHEANSPGWGIGLERFEFYSTPEEIKQWHRDVKLPKIITPESLAEAPDAVLALFRSAVRFPLLKGMAVGEIEGGYEGSNLTVNKVIESLVPNQIQVGDIYTEPWDKSRTTNHVLPLITDKGIIEVVVNPAWGINWRLTEEHPVGSQFPQLTKVQNPDLSEPPIIDEEKQWGPRYLPVETLAQVTAQRVNPKELAEGIKKFLTKLTEEKDFNIQQMELINGSNTLGGDYYFSQIVLKSKKQNAEFRLGLGKKYGIKSIDAFGYRKIDERFTDLATQAINLRNKIRPLHELPA